MKRPTALMIFPIGAVGDFAFGSIKWHSIAAGVVAIVCGLPLTVLLFLAFREPDGKDDAGTPD